MRFGSTLFGLRVTTTASLAASILAVPTAAETFSVQHSGMFWDGVDGETTNGGFYTTVFTFEASAVDDLVITEDEITSFTATTTDGVLPIGVDDAIELFPAFVYDASNSTFEGDGISDSVSISLNLVSPGVYEVDDEPFEDVGELFSNTSYRIVTNDNTRALRLISFGRNLSPIVTDEDDLQLDLNGPARTSAGVEIDGALDFNGAWTQIVVPEPGSLAMLGVAGLFLSRRRR